MAAAAETLRESTKPSSSEDAIPRGIVTLPLEQAARTSGRTPVSSFPNISALLPCIADNEPARIVALSGTSVPTVCHPRSPRPSTNSVIEPFTSSILSEAIRSSNAPEETRETVSETGAVFLLLSTICSTPKKNAVRNIAPRF
eukprot:CAMPEP_0184547088 /NCGR_PEP_ID=MMETSP0199_2-20130426/5356_1 /TAXON_ID=1112570 /ORGANISM="Thraustochytrium sp., Strain LLF1b" /LENGTH=142 /DNA_ID=CAMNT_0026941541 /DNA_START=68 /DNA_END=496 /DNA_ORIENTATION=+